MMKIIELLLAFSLLFVISANAEPTIPAGATTVFMTGSSVLDADMDVIANHLLTSDGIASKPISIRDQKSEIFAYIGYSRIPRSLYKPVVLIVRKDGGSIFGVNAVAKAQRIKTIDLTSCHVNTEADADRFGWICLTKGTDYNSQYEQYGLIPDIGLSLTEPAMFMAPYNVAFTDPISLTSTELARLDTQSLQLVLLGLTATDAVPDTYHFSRAAYGAMLSGAAQDWSIINSADHDPVVVCRRINGSGTQAAFNWFFSGYPCNKASNGYVNAKPATTTDSFGYLGGSGFGADPIIIDPSYGYTVVENNTAEGVSDCLKAAQKGQDFYANAGYKTYKILFSNTSGPSKAIGLLSLAISDKSAYRYGENGNGWSYRQMDGAGRFNTSLQVVTAGPGTGISPSKQNLLDGKYDFVVELSMQVRNTTVTNSLGDVVAPIKTNYVKESLYDELTKYISSENFTWYSYNTEAFATLPTVDSYILKPLSVSKFSREGNTCGSLKAEPPL